MYFCVKSYVKLLVIWQFKMELRIDYGDDGTLHVLEHLNLNSSALDYPN